MRMKHVLYTLCAHVCLRLEFVQGCFEVADFRSVPVCPCRADSCSRTDSCLRDDIHHPNHDVLRNGLCQWNVAGHYPSSSIDRLNSCTYVVVGYVVQARYSGLASCIRCEALGGMVRLSCGEICADMGFRVGGFAVVTPWGGFGVVCAKTGFRTRSDLR